MVELIEQQIVRGDPRIAELDSELLAIFKEFGVDVERISPKIIDRLLLLDSKTETLRDCLNQVAIERKIFANLPEGRLSFLEQATAVIGTIFSDIGKTGPANATPDQQELIAEIFGEDNVFEPSQTTVKQFFKRYFPERASEFINRFQTIQDVIEVDDENNPGHKKLIKVWLDSGITMRQFFDMHTKWTLDIINHDGVPPEGVAAAATHHFAQGINPEGIIGKDNTFKDGFGENKKFDLAEKLVAVMDQYDARRRRAGLEHKEAVAGVKTYVEKSSFKGDSESAELIDVLEPLDLN